MWVSRTTSAPRTSRNSSSSAWQAAGRGARDVVDRAVVLAQPDRAVGIDRRLGEIALLGLDDRELADPVLERRAVRRSLGELVADAVAELAPARGEDLLEQLVATDRADRREQAGGQRVVGRGEEVLGVGRDVVQVPRPARRRV